MFAAIQFSNRQLYPGQHGLSYNERYMEYSLRSMLKKQGYYDPDSLPPEEVFCEYELRRAVLDMFCTLYSKDGTSEAGACYVRGIPVIWMRKRHLAYLWYYLNAELFL